MIKLHSFHAIELFATLCIWKPAHTAEYTIEDLGIVGQSPSYGRDVNNYGHVVGFSTIAGVEHSHVWTATERKDIDNNGLATAAVGLNDHEDVANLLVVGQAEFSGTQRAFIWSDGIGIKPVFEAGEVPSAGVSVANDVNDGGHVAGWYRSSTSFMHEGFIAFQNTWEGLGNLGGINLQGSTESIVYSINEDRMIVGLSYASNGNRRKLSFGIRSIKCETSMPWGMSPMFSVAQVASHTR